MAKGVLNAYAAELNAEEKNPLLLEVLGQKYTHWNKREIPLPMRQGLKVFKRYRTAWSGAGRRKHQDQ